MGQRIAFRSSDGIDYVVGALAILQCGAAVVPVADSLTTTEVHETIERIDVQGILSHRNLPHSEDEPSSAPVDDTFVWQPRRTGSELDQRCRELRPHSSASPPEPPARAKVLFSAIARSSSVPTPPIMVWPSPIEIQFCGCWG